MLHVLSAHRIDYGAAIRAATGSPYGAVVDRLLADLPARWDRTYREMCARPVTVRTTAHDGRYVRLEIAVAAPGQRRKTPQRVIAVYGRSRWSVHVRDDELIGELLAAMRRRRSRKKGESLLAASGRMMDMAALIPIPSREKVWSPRDRVVAEMERFCESKRGIFFFVRPIYEGSAITPVAADYGVLRDSTDFWVERFAL